MDAVARASLAVAPGVSEIRPPADQQRSMIVAQLEIHSDPRDDQPTSAVAVRQQNRRRVAEIAPLELHIKSTS
jgi:hypothetical protein